MIDHQDDSERADFVKYDDILNGCQIWPSRNQNANVDLTIC
jgi:hypothetical protein